MPQREASVRSQYESIGTMTSAAADYYAESESKKKKSDV